MNLVGYLLFVFPLTGFAVYSRANERILCGMNETIPRKVTIVPVFLVFVGDVKSTFSMVFQVTMETQKDFSSKNQHQFLYLMTLKKRRASWATHFWHQIVIWRNRMFNIFHFLQTKIISEF